MKFRLFYKNFFIVLGIDFLLLTASFYGAHLVRFEFEIPPNTCLSIKWVLPLLVTLKIFIFHFFDLYRGMWRYTSLADLFNIIKASTLSTLIIITVILFKTRFQGFSRSVFVIDWCLTILFISAFRLSVRVYFEHLSKEQLWKAVSLSFFGLLSKKRSGRKNLLIIGAGDCGEKIYREIRDNARLLYNVVGFLDDNSTKIGKKIHGIPVLSSISDIREVAKQIKADEALIAIPSASASQMRKIIEYCKGSDIDFKTIPSMGELINGKLTINAIREVAYRDLLGRELIKLDEEQIGSYLKGQNVMVTGAGGSIGSELCRQICRFHPQRIILFERAESPLYEIELELKQNFSDINIVPLLADVQDKQQIKKAFENYRPQTVFHAAAYKHVPMLEMQPWKVVKNNIWGTANLVEIANKFSVERFVFVSTDKAVRPANVMGASKRVAEMLIQSQNGCGLSQSRFMIVRFGNVVGSVGSVVPLFKKQIAKGGPVTVTHPEVTRYFMTIPESCQLILQAAAMGSGGEIFVLKMGTPIKIDDMARDLIRLSGFEPDVDIKIEYIGLRPGEKLNEELIIEGEGILPTSHEKIMVLKGLECDLQLLNGNINELTMLAEEQNQEKIKAKLQEIVPEYIPANHGA
uniref:Polysaccharide biosynthesis protein n=1 Tax=Candidatus Desulfatibia profunda TaxID=2841695 RepID=A0A8J6NMS3_9BACT|nr:polysaccharide biosynthesis protein [Candidatus Desulfatibia profunda]